MDTKVLGDGPTTLRSRVGELEKDKTTRLAVQATIGMMVTVAVAIGSSGVIGAVDKMVKKQAAIEAKLGIPTQAVGP